MAAQKQGKKERIAQEQRERDSRIEKRFREEVRALLGDLSYIDMRQASEEEVNAELLQALEDKERRPP